MDELLFRPVAELAALVKGGDVKPRELVEASLRRIEAHDGSIGAFTEVAGEQAIAEAEQIDRADPRPFAGVPIAVKGNTPVKGLLLNHGSSLFGDFRAGHDAFLVSRLREAGFVVVGTTKLPEFGILPTTEPRRSGPARNPWNLEHTPGGSSGGSSAAVAAGLVPIAHGNDGGGSIRIPAACCGLVGLKPSRGRISRGPDSGDSFLATDGVLTRTVLETAQLLDVLGGYEVGDANWVPRPSELFSTSIRRSPTRLRIAVTDRNPLGAPLDDEHRRVLIEAAKVLAEAGHEIVDASPTYPEDGSLLGLFAGLFGPAVSVATRFGELVAGREATDEDIEPLSAYLFERAKSVSSIDFQLTMLQLQRLSRDIIAFFADHDVLLMPALAERPLPIGECNGHSSGDPREAFARSGQFVPYTALWNVTGQPAISLPIDWAEDGMPVAVQLVGPPLGDDTLLQLAAQIEVARPWADRRPALVVDA